MIDALNIGLAALILGLAVWSVVAREAFAAVAGFIAYGLLLTLAWVQLHGIDVALTEAAIGGGLTGALLIGAAARLRGTEAAARAERPGTAVRWLAAGVSVAVTVGAGARACSLCPTPRRRWRPMSPLNIAITGVGNPITAVLLAFRAMDTLLEAIVLLFALIGVWSLAPDRFWGGRPGLQQRADPNGILAYVARLLPPIGIVVGIYIFWVGADHPGGKFQGATILAAMWLLVDDGRARRCAADQSQLAAHAAGGRARWSSSPSASLGVLTAGAFLAYPEGIAKPLILAIEFALMPTLTLILGLMLVGAPRAERPLP